MTCPLLGYEYLLLSVSRRGASVVSFPPSFDVAASGKIQDEEISEVPTPDPYLSPPSGTLPRRRLAGRGGGLLSLTRHGRSDGWGTMLFELSVGLAGYRYGNAEEPVFFRDDRGQRELSDGVGPCGAMVSFFPSHLDQLDAGRTGQGGKLADRLNRPRGPSTGALKEVEPAFSHLNSRGEYLGESDVAVGVPKQEKRGPDEVTVYPLVECLCKTTL